MASFQSRFIIFTLAAALSISGIFIAGPAGAAGCDAAYDQSREPNGAVMLIDGVVVRPLTFVASVAGAAIWVVTLPFTLLGGNTDEAGAVLVTDPMCYTFVRPLGYMEKTP